MNAVTEVMDELRKALAELEDCRARNADLRTMLEQVTRERDEARTSCPDCAMWAERSTRWHDDMQRAERERDEARDDFAFAMRKMDEQIAIIADTAKERDEARAEVERLRAEAAPTNEHFNAGYRDGYRDAYRRGAEAMREACAAALMADGLVLSRERAANVVRALPIPEEP